MGMDFPNVINNIVAGITYRFAVLTSQATLPCPALPFPACVDYNP
jgi:hypothetical protein